MSDQPYTKVTEYYFEAGGENLAVSTLHLQPNGEKVLSIEETSKNGQEDTHMAGVLVMKPDSKQWEWEEGLEQFEMYSYSGIGDAILEYLNANPHPEL